MKGLRLRHLVFVAPDNANAELEFDEGLNIIYGASNTGKSFASKTILFMLGASKSLPAIEETGAYRSVLLGITLADLGDFTLYRAVQGGHFNIYEGLTKRVPDAAGQILRDKHDRNRTDTLSNRLLDAIGLAGRWVVRDGNGTKDSLSIRSVLKYAVVAEDDILSEASPVFISGAHAERTVDRNLFKLLLTGQDDVAVVTVPKEADRRTAKAAKIELVDEMLAQLDAELGELPPDEQEARAQLQRLESSVEGLLDQVQAAQSELDELVVQRRDLLDGSWELSARAAELELTLQRYAKLQAVYASDLDRLNSIEESGFVLTAMVGRDCPVCGAPPGAQVHNHAAHEISTAYAAAAAEARKIEREQRELRHVVASLEAEASGLSRMIQRFSDDVLELDVVIDLLRPEEASLRTNYESLDEKRAEVTKLIDLYDRRAKLATWRAEIDAAPVRRNGDAAPVGPDSTAIYEFGETVKSVLVAWKFPDAEKAQFDGLANDITIGGKPRSANGKGVRAILHAAFNVAVLVHCINRNLPHPGFLVLDTPLLTYRAPLNSRHGDLTADEQVLKASSLAEHFYEHLAGLKPHAQIIVVENSDPPSTIENLARIEVFTRQPNEGRFGLLAPRA